METKTNDAQPPVVAPLDVRVRPLVELLRTQAKEIADAGHNGWGNTMLDAANEIERLRLLTFCGCGDQFTAHDPGTCGACVAGLTCNPGA